MTLERHHTCMKRSLQPISWQQNLVIIWIAEVMSIAGFSVVLPFLPYYIQELGITGTQDVAFWSGLLTSSQAITMALIAPVWGSLSDRYGRKIMVARSMYGGAVIMSLMGFAQSVQQLAVLRAIQGLLTGTVAAATTLVASTTPPERRGFALGLLQMAIYLGSSLGPFIGGFVADQFGYRAAFWVTGSLLLVSGILVTWMVREDFTPVDRSGDGDKPTSMWQGLLVVLGAHTLMMLFIIRMLIRMASQIVGPVMPLFIQSIAAQETRIASLTGVISGLASAAAALGAALLGRASDKWGARRILVACAVSACALYALQSRVNSPVELLILRILDGLAVGGLIASISALQAALAPKARFGAMYGIDTSLVAAANAIAPMIGASLTVTWGLRSVFVGAALMFGLVLGMTLAAVPAGRAAYRSSDPS